MYSKYFPKNITSNIFFSLSKASERKLAPLKREATLRELLMESIKKPPKPLKKTKLRNSPVIEMAFENGEFLKCFSIFRNKNLQSCLYQRKKCFKSRINEIKKIYFKFRKCFFSKFQKQINFVKFKRNTLYGQFIKLMLW